MKAALLAGDSPVRVRLAQMLSDLPYLQLQVEDLEADLDLMKGYDVVLIDIDQACGRGLQIIRKLREKRVGDTPTVVALASSRPLRYRASCLKAGATYFFDTTRELEWLLSALQSIRECLGE
jgi:CheY-like chemotaxis protein